MTVVSPDTATGFTLSVVVPLPSWPLWFLPQHFTDLVASTAHVADAPAERPISAVGFGMPASIAPPPPLPPAEPPPVPPPVEPPAPPVPPVVPLEQPTSNETRHAQSHLFILRSPWSGGKFRPDNTEAPARACRFHVARVDRSHRIGEANCANGCCFYEADVIKVVSAQDAAQPSLPDVEEATASTGLSIEKAPACESLSCCRRENDEVVRGGARLHQVGTGARGLRSSAVSMLYACVSPRSSFDLPVRPEVGQRSA